MSDDIAKNIQAEFHKLNANYTIYPSTMNEIIFIGTSSKANREFHRNSPVPNMPSPKQHDKNGNPLQEHNSWHECSLNTSVKEIDKIKKAAEKLLNAIDKMHSTTIYALANNGFYSAELEKMLENALKVTEKANENLNDWKIQYPEWIDNKSGQPKKEVAFHIAKILADEYHRATGNAPSLTSVDSGKTQEVCGHFFNLVKSVFNILGIKASPQSMSREARDWSPHRKASQDNLTANPAITPETMIIQKPKLGAKLQKISKAT